MQQATAALNAYSIKEKALFIVFGLELVLL